MDVKHQFLHDHPKMESKLGLDQNHVIVDRRDWEFARGRFMSLDTISQETEAFRTKLHAENKELREAFTDVLDGNSNWYEIRYIAGLPEKRCREIEALFNRVIQEGA